MTVPLRAVIQAFLHQVEILEGLLDEKEISDIEGGEFDEGSKN